MGPDDVAPTSISSPRTTPEPEAVDRSILDFVQLRRLNLSHSRILLYRKKFARRDLDGDDMITMVEFGSFVRRRAPDLPDPVVARMFKRLDKDGNGAISFQEFCLSLEEIDMKMKKKKLTMSSRS